MVSCGDAMIDGVAKTPQLLRRSKLAYLRVLHLGLFEVSLCSLICLAITVDWFLRDHHDYGRFSFTAVKVGPGVGER